MAAIRIVPLRRRGLQLTLRLEPYPDSLRDPDEDEAGEDLIIEVRPLFRRMRVSGSSPQNDSEQSQATTWLQREVKDDGRNQRRLFSSMHLMMIITFGVMIVGGIAAFFADSMKGKAAIGALTALGSGLSLYIRSTIMNTFRDMLAGRERMLALASKQAQQEELMQAVRDNPEILEALRKLSRE